MKQTTYKQCTVPAAPANGTSEVEFTLAGEYFLLRRSTFPVSVKFDNEAEVDIEPGIILKLKFSRVKIINRDTDVSANVGFYVSLAPINFFPPNIRLPDTYFFAPISQNITVGSTLQFPPRSTPRYGQSAPDRRKSIELTNLHATNLLTFRVTGLDGITQDGGTVFPMSTRIIESTARVDLSNYGFATTAFQKLETYYFTP